MYPYELLRFSVFLLFMAWKYGMGSFFDLFLNELSVERDMFPTLSKENVLAMLLLSSIEFPKSEQAWSIPIKLKEVSLSGSWIVPINNILSSLLLFDSDYSRRFIVDIEVSFSSKFNVMGLCIFYLLAAFYSKFRFLSIKPCYLSDLMGLSLYCLL